MCVVHLNMCVCLCVHFMCVQKAAPTRRVSAMRAASVGATQPSTDKLKVQTNVYDFTPCISNVADGHFCEMVCFCLMHPLHVFILFYFSFEHMYRMYKSSRPSRTKIIFALNIKVIFTEGGNFVKSKFV